MKNLPTKSSLIESSSFITHSALDRLFALLKNESEQATVLKKIGTPANPDFTEHLDEKGIALYRKKHQKTLNEIFSSLFQANELFIKSLICEIDPKELLSSIKSNDFLECVTLDASKLINKTKDLNIYDEIPDYIKKSFHENRINRNSIMHTFSESREVSIKSLLIFALELIRAISPCTPYFQSRVKHIMDYYYFDPSSDSMLGVDYDMLDACNRLNGFEEIHVLIEELPPHACMKYLSVNKKKDRNRFYCPSCIGVMEHELSYSIDESSERTLIKNADASLKCIICGYEAQALEREQLEECLEYGYGVDCIMDSVLRRCISCGHFDP